MCHFRDGEIAPVLPAKISVHGSTGTASGYRFTQGNFISRQSARPLQASPFALTGRAERTVANRARLQFAAVMRSISIFQPHHPMALAWKLPIPVVRPSNPFPNFLQFEKFLAQELGAALSPLSEQKTNRESSYEVREAHGNPV